MTEWEAVEKRISCRAYAERPVEEPTLEKLRECMAQLQQRAGLPFQLCTAPAGQPAVKLSGTMFSGTVSVCAALAGAADPLVGEYVRVKLESHYDNSMWVIDKNGKSVFYALHRVL